MRRQEGKIKLLGLRHRVPLTIKMTALAVVVSLSGWFVLDHALTYKVGNVFHDQLNEKPAVHEMRDRQGLYDSPDGMVIKRARKERFILALTFFLIFVSIIYGITYKIQKLTAEIAAFSEKTLGIEVRRLPKGDQLYILNERFRLLTEEIAHSREIIRKQAEEKTRRIVNNAFDAIITTDRNGVIMTWNPRAESVFGWPQEETTGKIIYDLIVPRKHHEECRKKMKDIMSGGVHGVSRENIEITCRNRKGKEFSAEYSVSMAGSGAGIIFIYIIRDITERMKAEKKIEKLLEGVTRAKNQWEMTFNNVGEMITLVDKDFNIIRCNRSLLEFTKKPDVELVGSTCMDYLLCNMDLKDIMNHYLEKGPLKKIEVRTEKGCWLYVSHFPVFDEKGEFDYAIIVATDITELKNTQQKVMESQDELRERVDELEKFYDLAVNREVKMISLKKEIAQLKGENEYSEKT